MKKTPKTNTMNRKILKRSARKLAKTNFDFKINEENYKADFEVLNNYIGFSAEILRISLLAIGGFGALVMAKFERKISLCLFPKFLLLSICFFILTSFCALIHRYVASDSMAWQISFLRKYKRESWARAAYERHVWYKMLNLSKYVLLVTGLLFALAVFFFGLGIWQIFELTTGNSIRQ